KSRQRLERDAELIHASIAIQQIVRVVGTESPTDLRSGLEELMKGRGIGAPVRLRFSLEFFDDLHLLEINYTDGVVVCVRGVELFKFRHIFNAFGTRRIGYDRNDTICAQVDHVGLVRGEVRGDQVVIVLINRQVIKPLPPWAWQIKRGDFLQSRSCLGDSRCCNAEKESGRQK